MKRDNLSTTEKRRFEKNNICPICGKQINDNDNLLFTVKKKRRCKLYTFYHERCLKNGETKEEWN